MEMEHPSPETENPSQAPTGSRGRRRKSVEPKDRMVIGDVTYLRDAFGCYVPEGSLVRARGLRVRTPKDALPALAGLRNSPQEIFLVMDLDGNHQVIEAREVTVGLVNQSQIHPRETFRGAIKNNAVSILIAHNHPSGNLEPSESDLTATRRLVEVSKTIGIPILDHLIVCPDGFVSLRERFPAYFI
jgi:DNA repair protein RadC